MTTYSELDELDIDAGDRALEPVRVMFMQSQAYFGSDSGIHSLMMRYLDRERAVVHVACNAGSPMAPSASYTALSTVPDLSIVPTRFGPTVNQRGRSEVLRAAVETGPFAAVDLTRLVTYVRRNRIQIIHCTEKPRDAFYGYLVARASGAKCIIHLHVKVEGWMSPLTRWAMRRCDGLVGVSEFVARSAIAEGFDPDRVHAVLNALDANEFCASVPDTDIRAEFGVPAERPLLAIISRVFPWKGHSLLLRALAEVKRSGRDFTLLIVGDDDPRATPGRTCYSAELRPLVAQLGLTEEVVFTGFRSDAQAIMAACDIYTMPTFEEPCAVVFLEAMALARPIVSLDSGGVPEVVQHGTTGLLSPPEDVDALVRNLCRLIDDEALRRTLGANGRTRLVEHFGPDRLATDIERVYRRVLAGESAPRLNV
jgi:glycosyltransferase involved in cell wall biosynthesis